MALIFCSHCGKQVSDKATTCPHCNAVLQAGQPQVQPQPAHQPVYVNVPGKQSNGIGTTGLVFAILGIFLGWIPILGWIIWFLGALFSFIGLFKSPRGCAIAGLIISFIWVIVVVFVVGSIGAFSLFS